MANKMLIDASHPEETRVVVLRGNRVEEFDFEAASKKQLRGNIYLAKVTRVEPSLQAAFVEYGGNRHGFLAFSEIHPDYYQIPHADRVALLEEESRAHREEEDEDSSRRRSRRNRRGSEKRRNGDDERVTGEIVDEDGAAPPDGTGAHDIRESAEGAQDEAFADASAPEGAEDSLASEVPATEVPEFHADAGEAPVSSPSDEASGSAPVAAEAPAGEPQAVVEAVAPDSVSADAPAEAQDRPEAQSQPGIQDQHHPLLRDPEGFAVVEEGVAPEAAPDAEAEPTDVEDRSAPAEFTPVEQPDDLPDDEDEDEDHEVQDDDEPAYAQEDGHEDAQDDGHEDGREDAHRPRHAHEGKGRHAHRGRSRDRDRDREPGEQENGEHEHEEEEIVEQLGGDAMDETPYRVPRSRRQYKIQEVIKRRQVLLIQVVKEERGNKGAALTTYLSLAGRYSVLMPNTARGGGISRKITDTGDRKRLKEIAGELEVPEGMGVILRTAGAARTKQEIQRDFEYLMRMWEQVRELTLSSSAPALVYEEGSLIKRAIRDLYNKEIDEVVVAGENGYREARDFMRLLMPSHVKNVAYYRDPQPIFAKWGAESQLDALFHNQVTLRSGGYLVINQTEALVAIDVNSGRSTREHNIEDTALRTNLEAADEVARQLRLRDLAGLIVVDFIDMEESRNNRSVERRLKEALKDDRARIQVGRISHFGLLEMSRQRIRTGVLEGSSVVCPHCAGAGTVRSTSSVAVHVMRVLEDALLKSSTHNVILRSRTDIALYILNHKRALLRLIEERFGVEVIVEADDTLTGGAYHALERGEPADPMRRFDPRRPLEDPEPIGEAEVEAEFEEETESPASEAEAEGSGDKDESESESESESRRRRRRRRGRGRGFERESGIEANAPQPSDEGLGMMAEIGGDLNVPVEAESGDTAGGGQREPGDKDDGERRGRGRWRRRGRGPRSETTEFQGDWRPSEEGAPVEGEGSADVTASSEGEAAPEASGEVETRRAEPAVETPPGVDAPDVAETEAEASSPAAAVDATETPVAPHSEAVAPAPEAKPARAPVATQPDLPVITAADPTAPRRSGWWSRAKANLTGK